MRLQENPGEQEFETVSNIRKRMKELINVSTFSDDLLSLALKVAVTLRYVFEQLQENSSNGMTTLPLQLLKDVLGLLWTFLLFHQGDGAETDGTSRYITVHYITFSFSLQFR